MFTSIGVSLGILLSENISFLLLLRLFSFRIEIAWLLSIFLLYMNSGRIIYFVSPIDWDKYCFYFIISFVLELYLIFKVVLIPRLFSFIGWSEYIFKMSSFEVYLLWFISFILIDEFNGNCGVKGFVTCYVKTISRLLAYDGVQGFSLSEGFLN